METVAIIEPKSCGRNYLIKARQRELHTVLLTADRGERYVDEPFRRHADRIEVIDTNNDEAVIEHCLRLQQRMHLSAVIPGFEYYVPLAAKVSAALGLPGLAPERVEALRFKDAMRAALVAAGLRTPIFERVESEAAVYAAIDRIGLPVVVKPIDGSGSTDVRRVDTVEQAIAAFRTIQAKDCIDLDRIAKKTVLIEEYIVGRELSAEGFVQNSHIHLVSLTEKLLGPEPYFVEAGHIVEGDFSAAERSAIVDYAQSVVRALGLDLGPFHCELRIDDKGPVLMEIGARLPGDQITDLVGYATDVDLYEAALDCYLGVQRPVQPTSRRCFAGIRFLLRDGLSRYSHVSGLKEVERWPSLKQLLLYYKAGDSIPPLTDWLGRVGYGVFVEETYGALKARLNAFDRSVVFS